MKVIEFNPDIKEDAPTVVTIGNFDGVHIGHQELIKTVLKDAEKLRANSALVTFDPHPQEVLNPSKIITKIFTPQMRERLLKSMGLDSMHIIEFTKDFSKLSAEKFALKFLIERFNLAKLIVGYDFCFGKNRSGNIDTLKELSQKYDFELEVIDKVTYEGEVVSSSLIRELIIDNDFTNIANYLGRSFSILSKVVKGDQRGRTIGFNTANIIASSNLPLTKGVYITETKVGKINYQSVTNVGVRPTVANKSQVVIETHIFDFDFEIYDEMIEVWPLKKIRDEKKFESIDELKSQIAKDIKETKQFFSQD